MPIIRRVEGGWVVQILSPEGSAATKVTERYYEEAGQDAFDEAISFLEQTMRDGYA